MPRPPQRFVAQLRRLDSPFTSEDVQQRFPKLRPSSISVYLSHAAKAGLIHQVGFKTFVHASEPQTDVPLPRPALEVTARLKKRLLPSAMEQLVVWTSDSLAPFTHDAIVAPFVIVEAPKPLLNTIAEALEEEFETTVTRSYADFGRRLWESPSTRHLQVFLVPTSRLDGTERHAMGFQVPTLSRLLVTILHVPPLMPETALEVMARPEFDFRQALMAAPSRQSAALLGALLVWVRDQHPTHPVRDQADQFVHGFTGGR